MKRLFLIFYTALLAFPFGHAHAQSLMESSVAGSIGMGALYGATKTFNSESDDVVTANLQRQGYTNISPVPSSPSQYSAFVPNLGPVLVTVEPKTGQVLSVMPK